VNPINSLHTKLKLLFCVESNAVNEAAVEYTVVVDLLVLNTVLVAYAVVVLNEVVVFLLVANVVVLDVTILV